jgi:hypothetical protein
MNYQVIDNTFLSLVNFDDLPPNEAVLLDLFEYVFVPSSRNAPEEITKPPFRSSLWANDAFLGNLLLGLDENDQWISLYLSPERPLKNRTQFCKAFFLEAIQYFINQSSKPQFIEIYRRFYTAISVLNFVLPYVDLIARLQAMYRALYNELGMPKLEEVGRAADAPLKDEKHGAFARAPSAPTMTANEAHQLVTEVRTNIDKAKGDLKEQNKILDEFEEDLTYKDFASRLQRLWVWFTLDTQSRRPLLDMDEKFLRFLIVESKLRDEKDVETSTKKQMQTILNGILYGRQKKQDGY